MKPRDTIVYLVSCLWTCSCQPPQVSSAEAQTSHIKLTRQSPSENSTDNPAPPNLSLPSSGIPPINSVTSPSRITALIAQQKRNQPSHLIRPSPSLKAQLGAVDGAGGGTGPGTHVCKHWGIDGSADGQGRCISAIQK